MISLHYMRWCSESVLPSTMLCIAHQHFAVRASSEEQAHSENRTHDSTLTNRMLCQLRDRGCSSNFNLRCPLGRTAMAMLAREARNTRRLWPVQALILMRRAG